MLNRVTKKRWIVASFVGVIGIAMVGIWAVLHIAPPPSGYSTVDEDVAFYPACGDTPLVHEGVTWYPISRSDWPTPVAKAAAASGGHGIALSVPMVAAPPGPGDDVGKLYIYPHGMAYWVSDSGDFYSWLTRIPQTYDWVC